MNFNSFIYIFGKYEHIQGKLTLLLFRYEFSQLNIIPGCYMTTM